MSQNVVIAAVAGLVVGGAVGYYVSKEIEGRKNEHYINSEIQAANEFYKEKYKKLYKADGTPSPVNIQNVEAKTLEEIDEQIENNPSLSANWIQEKLAEREELLNQMKDQAEPYQGTDEEPEEVETVEEKEENVFEKAASERDPAIPFLISIDEFMEDRQDFDKVSVTYFEGDGTLIDEAKETPLQETERLVGTEFSDKFGKKSKDEDTVYIRNEALEVDFEITRDTRSFEDWILGPEKKVKSTKKMREDD